MTLQAIAAVNPVATAASGARLQAAIPGAAHVVSGEAVHMASVEQPERVGDALLRHLIPSEEAA